MTRYLFLLSAVSLFADQTLLLQQPTLSKTKIVFSYGGDLWSVSRDGGEAIRLTAGPGEETAPLFSPDGMQVAFQGEYDGNMDVFVVAATGGVPRRLTYHPGNDRPVGWSPDGKRILFRSNRASYSRFERLYTVPVEGGPAAEVSLPMADMGSYSPDGSKLAYMPLASATEAWKRYRGGRTTPIWIANLADSKVEKLPHDNSNDSHPMWIGDKIYFLSDRSGPVTLFAYDMKSKKVSQVIENKGLDFKSASAGPDAIAYEQFGSIHLYDWKSGKDKHVNVTVAADLLSLRPSFEKVSTRIANASLSPTGVRALFEARGEVFTVPAEKGDVRNLTNTSGAAERFPAWSPDGKSIAYFSDESGEYALHIRPQSGLGELKKIDLGTPPAFYFNPIWSPDSTKIAYTDNQLQLWWVDLETKKTTRVDKDTYETPFRDLNPDWSPDSKWIVYTKLLKNHLRAVFVYSLAGGAAHQVSDGLSDTAYAHFDKDGRHLYFTASTNLALTTAWLDMSSDLQQVSRSVYVAVLRKEDPSPIAPESDEEKPQAAKPDPAKPDAAKTEDKAVRIDFDNIDQRILALPIPERDYRFMYAGKTGVLFLGEVLPAGGFNVHKFDLKTRKTDKALDGVRAFDVSFNGEKMLFRQGPNWVVAATATPVKPGEGVLKIDAMQMHVVPQEEWRQMYREVWRLERDFFYDPGLHGVNLADFSKKYEKYLGGIGDRANLNYLFQEMLGELSVGHLFVRGGAQPDVKKVPGGLLGADYAVENGRYLFAKIYRGENWNPRTRAPLTQPGVNVAEREYLLAVNGRDVRPPTNVYSFFEETAGKSTVLRVGPSADGSGSREVTVVPIPNEAMLRNLSWIDENRRKVDQLSGGRLAYVYLPDTAGGGLTNFNRYYFAQIGKQGAVIDERFNGGGQIADFIIDYLKRPQTNFFVTRAGEAFTTPQNQIFGPKAMIINEYAGSGGDAMPWLFRDQKVGPLIGKRTWGGLVGIFGVPPLIDGGFVTAPNVAFYNLKGAWDVENHGVAPDIEVEFDPAAWRTGRDPQLERAVEYLLNELKAHPLPTYKQPPFPNYQKPGSTGGAANR
ncbi:MAG: PDZ domain-containing protein [Bryobacteraceae bacterium]